MIEGGENLNDLGFGGPTDEFGRHFDPFNGSYYVGHMPPDFEALNVHNPRDGFRYYYAVNPNKDGGSNLIHLNNKYGAELVSPQDQERIGVSRMSIPGLQNGSTVGFGDVVLVRISQERYDEVERREHELNRDALEGVIHTFKDGDPLSNGHTTRYVRDEHGIRIEDL